MVNPYQKKSSIKKKQKHILVKSTTNPHEKIKINPKTISKKKKLAIGENDISTLQTVQFCNFQHKMDHQMMSFSQFYDP